MRARYYDGARAENPWSGPWAEATRQVAAQPSSVVEELSTAEDDLTILNEQVARAKKRVSELREDVGHVGPPPEAVVRQQMNDRLGVIGRVLRADRHDIESMVSAFDDRGLFALRLEDRFRDPDWPYALEVEAIDNHLLLAALVDVASGADLEEDF